MGDRRNRLSLFLLALIPFCTQAQVLVGMTDTTAHTPLLQGARVAVLANHTAQSEGLHLVDLLHGRGFNITGIFRAQRADHLLYKE